jgi:chaperone BCS1
VGNQSYSVPYIDWHFSIDDAILQRLATAVPKGAILLIEDIDCAFPSREDDDAQPNSRRVVGGTFMASSMPMSHRSGVTLSGLLNVIDGVGSDEGRLFFATVCYFTYG